MRKCAEQLLPQKEWAFFSSHEKVKLGLNLIVEEFMVYAGMLSADHVVSQRIKIL